MVFKLVEGAQKNCRRIDGHNQLPKLIQGVRFTDGIEVIGNSTADVESNIPRQEILEELELQCDCLRDDISDIRIRRQPNVSDQKPTQNATQRANDQPVLGDRVRTNPPRPAHSRHPMFED
jgi:hypothetical protein